MGNSKLDEACLIGTRFDDANLISSGLRDSKIRSTAFTGGDLSRADFSDTKVQLANFKLEGRGRAWTGGFHAPCAARDDRRALLCRCEAVPGARDRR